MEATIVDFPKYLLYSAASTGWQTTVNFWLYIVDTCIVYFKLLLICLVIPRYFVGPESFKCPFPIFFKSWVKLFLFIKLNQIGFSCSRSERLLLILYYLLDSLLSLFKNFSILPTNKMTHIISKHPYISSLPHLRCAIGLQLYLF